MAYIVTAGTARHDGHGDLLWAPCFGPDRASRCHSCWIMKIGGRKKPLTLSRYPYPSKLKCVSDDRSDTKKCICISGNKPSSLFLVKQVHQLMCDCEALDSINSSLGILVQQHSSLRASLTSSLHSDPLSMTISVGHGQRVSQVISR